MAEAKKTWSVALLCKTMHTEKDEDREIGGVSAYCPVKCTLGFPPIVVTSKLGDIPPAVALNPSTLDAQVETNPPAGT